MADFDRLAARIGPLAQLSPEQRAGLRPRAPPSARSRRGRRSSSTATSPRPAYFILDGSTTAGIPVGDGYRGLSTMGAGDFFGEIAALTGSPRTADVVADVDPTLLEVPAEALRRDDGRAPRSRS